MPPVKSNINQYMGINAHLHSYFQNEGNWNSFHLSHISDIARLLQIQLRPLEVDCHSRCGIFCR